MFEYVTIRGRAYRKVNVEIWRSFRRMHSLMECMLHLDMKRFHYLKI
jgi:hypothetical protein